MSTEHPGFKGLVHSFLKAGRESCGNTDSFKIISANYNSEDGTWQVLVDVKGDPHYQRTTVDAEDLMGFMWDKISTLSAEQ